MSTEMYSGLSKAELRKQLIALHPENKSAINKMNMDELKAALLTSSEEELKVGDSFVRSAESAAPAAESAAEGAAPAAESAAPAAESAAPAAESAAPEAESKSQAPAAEEKPKTRKEIRAERRAAKEAAAESRRAAAGRLGNRFIEKAQTGNEEIKKLQEIAAEKRVAYNMAKEKSDAARKQFEIAAEECKKAKIELKNVGHELDNVADKKSAEKLLKKYNGLLSQQALKSSKLKDAAEALKNANNAVISKAKEVKGIVNKLLKIDRKFFYGDIKKDRKLKATASNAMKNSAKKTMANASKFGEILSKIPWKKVGIAGAVVAGLAAIGYGAVTLIKKGLGSSEAEAEMLDELEIVDESTIPETAEAAVETTSAEETAAAEEATAAEEAAAPAAEEAAAPAAEGAAKTTAAEEAAAVDAGAEAAAKENAEVDKVVKEFEYNPEGTYTVKKNDCLWNIVKGLLMDKNGGVVPTDTQIANGVRKMMKENGLSYTDDSHYYVRILPKQELEQVELD